MGQTEDAQGTIPLQGGSSWSDQPGTPGAKGRPQAAAGRDGTAGRKGEGMADDSMSEEE